MGTRKKTSAQITTESEERILEELRQFMIPIADLNLDPRNARLHDDRNIAAIAHSLKRFGQRRLAVVQKDGMVVRAGNGMIEAARRLGWKNIAAIVVDEPNELAREYALADNRTAELAEWDRVVLANELRELPAMPEVLWNAAELERVVLDAGGSVLSPSVETPTHFSVLIECDSEAQQEQVLEDAIAKGLRCRAYNV